jgi:1-aminocyclopropane-1-carboxylate deaminase/D-cysteine desulfhydrase-like pyridoxal-dependent ACC family enzyme
MPDTDYLQARFPLLGEKLPRMHLANLPTPVRTLQLDLGPEKRSLSIKYDNLTGSIYGGNKVRKLEYIFPRALAKGCKRIATFGATGSNHALATALYARHAGFECTCFLSHQAKTALVAGTLNKHLRNHTDLVRYGGAYKSRINTLRENLWGKDAWVIPMGGSSWLGTVGFVAAGLELSSQIENREIPLPDRLYVGSGTMGTAVGLALGLAIAELKTEVHAVRVSDTSIANEKAMWSLLHKTAAMLRRLDSSVPANLAARANLRMRHGFFGPGYAQSTAATDEAIEFAKSQLDITLESTYTGKTMAALLADLRKPGAGEINFLYWHTYNSVPLDVPMDRPLDEEALPAEFLRYF